MIGDQAKLSATYQSARTCISGPHYSIHQLRFEVKSDLLVLSRASPRDRSSFNLWFGNNTPPDIMELSLVCKKRKAWAVQCTKTLNFNEIIQAEQAGCRPWQPSYKHNYFASIAQPSENLSCYYEAEMIPSANCGLLQYSFQFLASASCTCSFSRRSNFCSRHQTDSATAVLRRGTFKRIAAEGAEYIKLGTQSHNFGVQIFCLVATSGNKLQYMIWDPGVHLSVCAISLEVTL